VKGLTIARPADGDSPAGLQTARSSAVTTGPWLVLAVVALGTFITGLDASIVNISLPSIARTFHAPLDGATPTEEGRR
jgi:hypothetical protein